MPKKSSQTSLSGGICASWAGTRSQRVKWDCLPGPRDAWGAYLQSSNLSYHISFIIYSYPPQHYQIFMRYNYISSYMLYQIFWNIELKKKYRHINSWRWTTSSGDVLVETWNSKKISHSNANNLWKLVRFEASNEKWPFLVTSCCVF